MLEEVWDYYEEALSIIAAAVSQHQSHATIPRLPPPVPSNRTSPCCIITPPPLHACLLFHKPFFFFINGLSAALELADAPIHQPLPANLNVNVLHKSSLPVKCIAERGIKLLRHYAALEAVHISPLSYRVITRKLWHSLDQSESQRLKWWEK